MDRVYLLRWYFRSYGVQVPFCTQPLFAVFPAAYRNTSCNPVKVLVNVNATLSVRLLPAVLKEEPVPDKVHWLFEAVPEVPGVTPADNPVPALL